MNYPEDHHTPLADAYGYDVTAWVGFPVFRRLRELVLVNSSPQLAGNPGIAQEPATRASAQATPAPGGTPTTDRTQQAQHPWTAWPHKPRLSRVGHADMIVHLRLRSPRPARSPCGVRERGPACRHRLVRRACRASGSRPVPNPQEAVTGEFVPHRLGVPAGCVRLRRAVTFLDRAADEVGGDGPSGWVGTSESIDHGQSQSCETPPYGLGTQAPGRGRAWWTSRSATRFPQNR